MDRVRGNIVIVSFGCPLTDRKCIRDVVVDVRLCDLDKFDPSLKKHHIANAG